MLPSLSLSSLLQIQPLNSMEAFWPSGHRHLATKDHPSQAPQSFSIADRMVASGPRGPGEVGGCGND